MSKYMIVGDVSPVASRDLTYQRQYKNNSSTAIIQELSFFHDSDEELRISLKLNSLISIDTLCALFPEPVRPIASVDRIACSVHLVMSKELQIHLTNICFILDGQDPFDDELKHDIQRELGVDFGFSEEELTGLIAMSIDSAMERVQARSPWQSFLLAELYKEYVSRKEYVTPEDIYFYIKCYNLVPETDSHYKEANQNICDFIMGLDLSALPEDVERYLRGEKLRAIIKLGLHEEASRLLSELCGDDSSNLSIPALTGLSDDHLLSQVGVMTTHLNNIYQKLRLVSSAIPGGKPTVPTTDGPIRISWELGVHLKKVCDILDELEPSVKERLNLQIEKLGNGSEESIEEKIDSVIEQVRTLNPLKLFSLAEKYNEYCIEKGDMNERDIVFYIKCYTSVPKTDAHYEKANKNIGDFLVGLDLEKFSDNFQRYLRYEKFKFELRKYDPLSQVIAMAIHISEVNQEMKSLKAKYRALNATSSGAASLGLFAYSMDDRASPVKLDRPSCKLT